jgi:hypothetical protein
MPKIKVRARLLNTLVFVKWFFWDIRVCRHAPGAPLFIDAGLKGVRCEKCGKLLEII